VIDGDELDLDLPIPMPVTDIEMRQLFLSVRHDDRVELMMRMFRSSWIFREKQRMTETPSTRVWLGDEHVIALAPKYFPSQGRQNAR